MKKVLFVVMLFFCSASTHKVYGLTLEKELLAYSEQVREQVLESFSACFGPIDHLMSLIVIPLYGGTHSNIYKLTIERKDYVLKIAVDAKDEERLIQSSELMKFSENLGYPPKLHYSDRTKRIFIMDFVSVRLDDFVRNRGMPLKELAHEIREIHRGPTFYAKRSIFERVNGMVASSNALGSPLPSQFLQWKEKIDEVADLIESEPKNLVFSHMDLHPGNNLIQDHRALF